MSGVRDRSSLDMESERRPFGLNPAMPSHEYPTSYSGALSDITPASHHALSTAYDDLKKRYNDLQGKYTQTAKQLRDAQRRGSSPDISSLNHTSPRHLSSSLTSTRSPRRAGEMENGDINQSDWELMLKERDLLERQVSELEHRLTESANQQAECEHESKQLREHVSRQEEDLRHSQQLLLRSENENEEFRKRETLLKRKLREAETDKERDRVRDMRSLSPAAGAAMGAGQSSLNSSLDSSTLGGRTSLSAVGSIENEDLASIVQTTVNVTHQMKELMTTVQKQRDVIKMLYKRLHDEREMFQRHLEAQRRNESAPCGIGARPKVRPLGGATGTGVAIVTGGGALPSGRSQVVNPVPCTEDVNIINTSKFKPPIRQRDPGKIGQHDLHSPVDSSGLMRSPERVIRSRLVTERHSAPAATPIGRDPTTGRHPLPPSEPPVDHELESHYDDLQIGGGVDVSWEIRHHQEDNKSETEPLLPSPRRLGRNESMEHLHDDSPPYDSLGDLGDSTSGSGSTLCGTDPDSEYDVPRYQETNPGGSVRYQEMQDSDSASTEDMENRPEGSSPRPRQRSLNVERTVVEPVPTVVNTETNTSINPHGGVVPRIWAPTTSTNNTIPPPQSSTTPTSGAGTSPVAPPRRVSTRVAVERGSGEEDTRNCPVCTEDFPSHMTMEEFQKHVLECPGRPERICPMCDAAFPDEVSQGEFERHVNEHFEDDVTIQNFEVLQS